MLSKLKFGTKDIIRTHLIILQDTMLNFVYSLLYLL